MNELRMMDDNLNNYLNFLSGVTLGNTEELSFSEEEWKDIFTIVKKTGVTAYTGSFIGKLHDNGKLSDELFYEWGDWCKSIFSDELIRLQEISRLLGELAKENIHPIFFKGYLLAVLYPGFGLRNSSDTDFLVKDEELEKARGILSKEYDFFSEDGKEKVLTYKHRVSGHFIEMHLRLWEDYEGRKIDILENQKLTAPENLMVANVFGMQLTTMNYTKHLIYQIFHIVKHFIVEGVGIRYLLDVSFFVNKHFDDIDWKIFWKAMDELEYTEFTKQFFSLGNKYFGLTVKALPGEQIVMPADYEAFVTDLILKGKVSDGQKGAFQIWGIMTPYLTGEATAAKSSFGQKLKTLFPSADNIRDDFAYAKKHHFLLPIAWVHRMIDYLIYRHKHPDESYSVEEKFNSSEYRVNMAKNRGLI